MQAKRGGFLTATAILLVLVAIEDVLKSFGQQGANHTNAYPFLAAYHGAIQHYR